MKATLAAVCFFCLFTVAFLPGLVDGELVCGGEFFVARAFAFGLAQLLAGLLGQFVLVVLLALGDALLKLADALAHAARELRQARAPEQKQYDVENDDQFPAPGYHPCQKYVTHYCDSLINFADGVGKSGARPSGDYLSPSSDS